MMNHQTAVHPPAGGPDPITAPRLVVRMSGPDRIPRPQLEPTIYVPSRVSRDQHAA